MADVLGLDDVLQVGDVVVASVPVLVVHLPGPLTGWSAEESVGNNTMDLETFSKDPRFEVAGRRRRSKRNSSKRVANPAM